MTMSQPYEIRLVVQPDPATTTADEPTYQAHWQNKASQPVTQPFPLEPPLAADDLKALRWYLETYLQFPGAGDRARAEGIERQMRTWGQALFATVFGTPECQQIYAQMQYAEAEGQRCQITIGCDIPAVLSQPWELLDDNEGPLTFRGITVRRQLPNRKKGQQPPFTLPLRLLLIVSRPEDVSFIDPRTSSRPLLEVVERLPPGLVEIDYCEPPTFARLEELISRARKRQQPYHIVHFDGHGNLNAKTGQGVLVFEDDAAHHTLVSGEQIGKLLSRLQVPLVILEACRSADLSDQPPHDSVAPALLQAGVSSVIAFSHSVHVEAARLLIARFYRELAEGLTIGQALDEARAGLHAEPRRWLSLGPDAEKIELQDWFIPQLYQVGYDLALFVGDSDRLDPDTPPPPPPELPGFPPPPRYAFQGRALELLRLERDFRKNPAVLLTGMGGMGKTALAREAAAWWLRKGAFDAAVFVSLEQRPPAERVVQLMDEALEGPDFSQRSEDEHWQWVVAAFRARRLLVVWDNAESVLPQFQTGLDAEIVRYSADDLARLRRLYTDLTAHQPAGRLLITCRPATVDWPYLKQRPLRRLARHDSLYLLHAVLERHATERLPQFERDELDGLLDLLADHPLSLELVGPHLLRLPPVQIVAEFGELLAEFTTEAADEERNRSLLASLEFSKRHLSDAAQALLPWLAWFSGGTFEDNVQNLAELSPEAWEPLLKELVSTALVRVEDVPGFTPRYLHFHPTLPYAAQPEQVPDPEAAEQCLLAVYRAVRHEADSLLRGQHPALGMALLRYEEASYRAALARAFRRGERQTGHALADTLREYLERAGRLRERNTLVQWVRQQMPTDGGLDAATCDSIRQHAWTLFTQGQPQQAAETLQSLLARLEQEGLADGRDLTTHQALTLQYLGRVLYQSGRADLSLQPLRQALACFERQGKPQQDNLAATLGDLANAHSDLGQHAAALAVAKKTLAIAHHQGHARNIASGLGLTAGILRNMQRYQEANQRYAEALQFAQAVGDHDLEGIVLVHQGGLQFHLGNQDEAVALYQQAMRLHQQASNQGNEMRTSDLLGSAERARGNLDAAQAWYERARELARRLNDRRQLGIVAQNLGILYQTRAEQTADPAQRDALLRQAVASVQEALAIRQDLQSQVDVAASFLQLGILYHLLGDLPQAATQLEQAQAIYEPLGNPELYKVYANLALVAHARGDAAAAAQWQIKREAKEAELVRRRGTRGEMPPLVRYEPLLRAIAAVARGDDTQRAGIEAMFPQMRAGDWGAMPGVIRRIWAGERALAALAQGLDVVLTALVARILQFVADPDAPPLLPEEEEQSE